jgi:hypothetical protein
MNKTQPKELFGIHTQHDVQTLNSSDKKDTRHNSLPEFRSLTTQQELSVQTQTVVHTLTATNTRNKRTAGRQSTRGRNVTWCEKLLTSPATTEHTRRPCLSRRGLDHSFVLPILKPKGEELNLLAFPPAGSTTRCSIREQTIASTAIFEAHHTILYLDWSLCCCPSPFTSTNHRHDSRPSPALLR